MTKSFEKKPMKGGTPAIENKHTVIMNSRYESKLNDDIKNKVLFFGSIFVDIDINKTIRLMLYKNM